MSENHENVKNVTIMIVFCCILPASNKARDDDDDDDDRKLKLQLMAE